MEMRQKIVLAAGVSEAEPIDHEGASLYPLYPLILSGHELVDLPTGCR